MTNPTFPELVEGPEPAEGPVASTSSANVPAVTELDAVGICLQAASLLLAYPDQTLVDRIPVLREALATTPWAAHFEPVLDHLTGQSLVDAQAFHVAEFDTSRRHALHLSYWTDGDTRRRGEVLAGIKQVYRDSGLLVQLDGELPDHLPLVLEFAALGDPERGRDLLQRYRASLELLRLQLLKDGLPHAGILEAVCATLPGDSPTSRAEVQAMYDASMPTETVGLDGYGHEAEPMVTVAELVEASQSLRQAQGPSRTAAGPQTTAAELVEATRPSLMDRILGRSKEKK